jgi:hypothetical protein
LRVYGFIRIASVCLALAAGGAANAAGQTMSFSVYSDAAISSDLGTLYAYTDGYDNSSGCSHGSYSTATTIYSPSNRTASNTTSGLDGFVGISLSAEYGNYTFNAVTTYHCSCFGPPGGGGGYANFGGGTTVTAGYWEAPYDRVQGSQEGCSGLNRFNLIPPCNHDCTEDFVCDTLNYTYVQDWGISLFGECTAQLRRRFTDQTPPTCNDP